MPADRTRHGLAAGALAALVAMPVAADELFPDEALLEFLAEWEDADGNFVDPLELDAYEIDDDKKDIAENDSDNDDR